MAFTELARAYKHLKVLDVELNIDVKKAQSNGTYRGSVITAKNIKEGKSEDVKVAQSYLDMNYPLQMALKAAFASVKSGDLITTINVKTTKLTLDDFERLSDDEKKVNSNWGVAEIIKGHVIPDFANNRNKPQDQNSISKTTAYKPKDMSGVYVGHSLNGAFSYLGGAKAIPEYVDAGKQIHVITNKVKAWYADKNPDFSEYDVGAASGNAVLNAINIARDRGVGLDKVEDYAKKILTVIVAELLAFIKAPEKAEENDFDGFGDTVDTKEKTNTNEIKSNSKPPAVEVNKNTAPVIDDEPDGFAPDNQAEYDDDIPF